MTTVEQCLEFFVTHNGEELKKQNESTFRFKDIFGDDFTNEDIEKYMLDNPPRYFETKDGVKFHIKHPFGTDIIHLFQCEILNSN